MSKAKSKQTKQYLRKLEYEERKQLNKRENQLQEALSIQREFGVYRDRVLCETVNLMTPHEFMYYLGITFGGVEVACVPDTAIKGCVLEQGLSYQFNVSQ